MDICWQNKRKKPYFRNRLSVISCEITICGRIHDISSRVCISASCLVVSTVPHVTIFPVFSIIASLVLGPSHKSSGTRNVCIIWKISTVTKPYKSTVKLCAMLGINFASFSFKYSEHYFQDFLIKSLIMSKHLVVVENSLQCNVDPITNKAKYASIVT